MTDSAPHVVVLGCNFAGLTTARLLRKYAGDAVDVTVIDRKDTLVFIPNIPLEVFNNRDPAETMHHSFVGDLRKENTDFIQGEVRGVDLESKNVEFTPTERPGAAKHSIDYDYVIFAVGAELAYDRIEGFGKHGHTFSDAYYANQIRHYLHNGQYEGGPIAVGSARFHQGDSPELPDDFPVAEAACEGPPVEIALSLGHWLTENELGGPEDITLFTPAELLAEDVGENIANQMLDMAATEGYNYLNNTEDITRLSDNGIEFESGDSVEAEVKIIFPDWVPHSFVSKLPITDTVGFVTTNAQMRNPDYPEVFAVGDCASLTVPKLGSLGHAQAEIASKQIAKDVGRLSSEQADVSFRPEVLCMGDMGGSKGFYIHSDVWYGGETEILKLGRLPHLMKLGFKEAYVRSGGKVPSWGVPLTEFILE